MEFKTSFNNILSTFRFELKRSTFEWKIVVAIAFAIIILVVTFFKVNAGESEFEMRSYFARMLSATVMGTSVAAVALASDLVSSEFEKGTGLILFTKPISKNQIFSGKFLAAYVLTTLVSLMSFAIVICIAEFNLNYLPETVWTLLGLLILYNFAVVGVCTFFSSICPKGLISAAVSLFVLLMLGMMLSQVIHDNWGDPWYILNYASNSIRYVAEGVIEGVALVPNHVVSSAVFAIYGTFSTLFAAILFHLRKCN